MSAPTTTRFVARYGTDLENTRPIRVVTGPAPARHAAPARPRRSTGRIVAAATLAVLVLVATAAAAFLLGGQNAVRSTAVAAPAALPTAAPVPAPAPAATPAAAKKAGPALVDDNGDALPTGLATVVENVYSALSEGDLERVRSAYSATGSDDWITSSSHLEKASVREKVLRTLRTTPASDDGDHVYTSGSYTVRFGQGDQHAEPGLLTIDGPWTTTAAQEESDSTAGSAENPTPSTSLATTSGSKCASGTRSVPRDGYPCTDIATGTGVMEDGTVGVHGLRPCPPGTTVPADPEEPTRNAATGEMCGMV